MPILDESGVDADAHAYSSGMSGCKCVAGSESIYAGPAPTLYCAILSEGREKKANNDATHIPSSADNDGVGSAHDRVAAGVASAATATAAAGDNNVKERM